MQWGYETRKLGCGFLFAPNLSNGTSLNDLQWPFQGHDYLTSHNLKMVQHTAILTVADYNRKSYMVYQTAPFSMTLNDPYPRSRHFSDAEYLINGTTYRHSFNEILIWTYTRHTQQCHFEWPWVILSDLAKYSTTRGVARSLCDSWASCLT